MAGKKTRTAARRAHSKERRQCGGVLHVNKRELPWTAHIFEMGRTSLLLLAKEREDWALEVVPVRVGPRRSVAVCGSFIVSKDGYDEMVMQFVDIERPNRHGVLYLQEAGGREMDLSISFAQGGEPALDLLMRREG